MNEEKELHREWLSQPLTREIIQKLKNAVRDESIDLANCDIKNFEHNKGFVKGIAYAIDLIIDTEDE